MSREQDFLLGLMHKDEEIETLKAQLQAANTGLGKCHAEIHGLHVELQAAEAQVTALQGDLKRYSDGCLRISYEVEQVLGKALGYPWFKDDQKNFPGATEADGVCIGEHVAESLADEAATKVTTLQGEVEALRAKVKETEDAMYYAARTQAEAYGKERDALRSEIAILEEAGLQHGLQWARDREEKKALRTELEQAQAREHMADQRTDEPVTGTAEHAATLDGFARLYQMGRSPDYPGEQAQP